MVNHVLRSPCHVAQRSSTQTPVPSRTGRWTGRSARAGKSWCWACTRARASRTA